MLPHVEQAQFLMFRDGLLSFDQLQARVDQKISDATYKCLDDLIAEGLDPKFSIHSEEIINYLKTIHHKESLSAVTI
jgi:hypothetical protein